MKTSEIIKSKSDLCKGCNRCVRECPMEAVNVTYLDDAGNIKVRIDQEKCIGCGRCISACKHDARYYEDDIKWFFNDLKNGVPISLIAAPSIRTNIPEYKKLFTYLKQLGVKKIFDVSLGADICIWAHVRLIEKNGAQPLITQPCPAIVNYCKIYSHDLLKYLSPVHSPMACTSVYIKNYRGIKDRIAAISPCIVKKSEFEHTGLADYSITFSGILEYLHENDISLPEEETEFDHEESGLGSLFPMPGGLKENLEFFAGNIHIDDETGEAGGTNGRSLRIAKAEGFSVYRKLDDYAATPEGMLPDVFDVLNCIEGCNIGTAVSQEAGVFDIIRTMDDSKARALRHRDREQLDAVYKAYDETLDYADFTRRYRPFKSVYPHIDDEDIENAFALMGKNTYEQQNIDCSACGSDTCYGMARKIALGVNIPINCMVKSVEDARTEHEKYIKANEQLVAAVESFKG